MATIALTLRRAAARRCSDEDVLNGALAGDSAAFAELYRRFAKTVYGYCLARLANPEGAADATQEVFLRVLRAEPAGDVENARAWLFRVATNIVVDISRSKRRDTPVANPEDSYDGLAYATVPDSADEVISREDARLIFLALRRLSPRYRSALILREFHGMSSVEMGQALGLRPGAVDTLVSRARDAFGRVYAEVAEFPFECRESVESIYQEQGSGLSPARRARLDAHLASCVRCRDEQLRAVQPRRLSLLWPLLVPTVRMSRGPLARALRVAQTYPGITSGFAPRVAESIAATVLVAALVCVPFMPGGAPSRGVADGDESAAAMTSVDTAPRTADTAIEGSGGAGNPMLLGLPDNGLVQRSATAERPTGQAAGGAGTSQRTGSGQLGGSDDAVRRREPASPVSGSGTDGLEPDGAHAQTGDGSGQSSNGGAEVSGSGPAGGGTTSSGLLGPNGSGGGSAVTSGTAGGGFGGYP